MKTIEVVAGIVRFEDASGCKRVLATKRGYGEFKGWWEFPGGKIENGETLQDALARELLEELAIRVSVDEFICTVDYDYPNFHLTMHCFFCHIIDGSIKLLEHEDACLLTLNEIRSVNWLPADAEALRPIEEAF